MTLSLSILKSTSSCRLSAHDWRRKMSDSDRLLIGSLTVSLVLLAAFIWSFKHQMKKDQESKTRQMEIQASLSELKLLLLSSTNSDLIKLIDKQVGIIASKGPLEYQAIQMMDSANVEAQTYDPTDAGELARMSMGAGGNAVDEGYSGIYSDDLGQPFLIR